MSLTVMKLATDEPQGPVVNRVYLAPVVVTAEMTNYVSVSIRNILLDIYRRFHKPSQANLCFSFQTADYEGDIGTCR
jgi:hypothetical protein